MPDFSPRLLRTFAQTLAAQAGAEELSAVLDKAGLPPLLADPQAAARFDASAAARAYADLQRAFRLYYGRGARGLLMRVGAQFWHRLLAEAALTTKARIPLARALATAAHPKPALDLLARLLSFAPGDITVHTLDLDLLFVDHASPAAHEQRADEPICWVTLGLVRQSLFWATNREYDVAEISCRANGAGQCEFKVTTS